MSRSLAEGLTTIPTSSPSDLNKHLLRAEDAFREQLGTAARGRVRLAYEETSGRFEHFVFRDGRFWIERSGKSVAGLFETSKRTRIAAAAQLAALWHACSGGVWGARDLAPEVYRCP